MRILFLLSAILLSVISNAQDIEVLLKQADNFDKQLKEAEAIDKYKEIIAVDRKNMKALVRLAELNAAIGSRQVKEADKLTYFQAAYKYADDAYFSIEEGNADAYYVMSLAAWKMSTVEQDNKKQADHLRKWKEWADRAISADPNHAKGHFLLGKWHFDLSKASFVKKAAAKTIYGGLPKFDIEAGIKLMEKAKSLDIYFVQNYYELAKAYEFNNQPTQQIQTLQKLVKLPNRTADDAGWKAEGKKMLEQMK